MRLSRSVSESRGNLPFRIAAYLVDGAGRVKRAPVFSKRPGPASKPDARFAPSLPPFAARGDRIAKTRFFTDPGREKSVRPAGRCFADVVQRLVPRVFAQRILRVVHRKYGSGFQIVDRPDQFVGHQVDVTPIPVVLPVLHDGQVDAGEFFAYLREMGVVAAVSRQVNPLRAVYHERGPQRPIPF